MKRTRDLIVFLTLVWGAWLGCNDRPAPFSPPSEDLFPPPPENVRAMVGDGQIQLRWDIRDSTKVKAYRVYRRQQGDDRPVLVDSTEQRFYVDRNLTNGRIYFHQVSAVSADGFEGKPSEEVSAVPHIYDLTIEDGREFTNRVSVVLRFTVREGTTLMKISNDSTFADASWRNFASEVNWMLSAGDGVKVVYAKFKDADGNENARAVSDRITLDTQATIQEVTEDTGGRVMAPGDVIHFVVVTGEPGGEAKVDIKFGRDSILLYDDGTSGDTTPEDGIYERDFKVPPGLQVNNGKIVARFVDRAGNVAPSVTATTVVTIQQPPSSVRLLDPSPIETEPNTLELSWSVNSDTDFSRYKLYRKEGIGVDLSSTLVATIFEQSTTSYRDTTLQPGTRYNYRLYVFDTSGLSTASNEVSGRTAQNQAPLPVVLSRPTVADSATLRLSWSRSTETDFASYRLYRSQSSPVDTSFAPIAIMSGDRNVTQYEDRSVVPNLTYFYRVFVVDKFGLSAGSNEVQGRYNR